MSKTGTFAASVTLASSAQGEGVQIDLGPYSGGNSPGALGLQQLAAGETDLSPVAGGPIYLVLAPVPQTSGLGLSLCGGSGDSGLMLSDTNPSFIPVVPNAGGEGQVSYAGVVMGAAGPLNIGWV